MNAIGSLVTSMNDGVVKRFAPVVKGAVGAAAIFALPLLYGRVFGEPHRREMEMEAYGLWVAAGACAGAVRVTSNGIRSLVGRATHTQIDLDTIEQIPLRLFTTAVLGGIVGGVWAWSNCRNRPSNSEYMAPWCIDYFGDAIFSAMIAGSSDLIYTVCDKACLIIGRGISNYFSVILKS